MIDFKECKLPKNTLVTPYNAQMIVNRAAKYGCMMGAHRVSKLFAENVENYVNNRPWWRRFWPASGTGLLRAFAEAMETATREMHELSEQPTEPDVRDYPNTLEGLTPVAPVSMAISDNELVDAARTEIETLAAYVKALESVTPVRLSKKERAKLLVLQRDAQAVMESWNAKTT